jgi:hypothetical protein
MRKARLFLLERTELVTPFTVDATFLIFRKNVELEKSVEQLFEPKGRS